ncbi:cytidyltransferase [Clostridium bowmanii]|uniref:cytidyltransferase n=1 Tax=Clostridium bowmanii TaxID=132925 RepID=UPI001C0AA812|nr:cytidyltransferase [Clostridium bowmanii]MBU3189790.1 cytidyltransferase [Clostridium bowmanii]MCA1074273.1 cytidyltransferase [Clostridium bowmanii]
MEVLDFKEVNQTISRKLLNPKFLKNHGIPKIIIENFLSSSCYLENLISMIENTDFTCKHTLLICEHVMIELCKDRLPEETLTYLYNFALRKSFPEAVTLPLYSTLDTACELYLTVLRIVCSVQRSTSDNTWQSSYAMDFLSLEEIANLENNDEYTKFIKAFRKDYIYEMMKLNGEVFKYNTLDHICGVHYLSLHIARQLKLKKVNIDLGRVSGAAAGHDVGKYGCIGEELKRVPHLHYYYTDQWFKKHGINYIRNIAINHSTWDLELENLSLESLILIYSDFRVKNLETSIGSTMNIFSLATSFKLILNKLENVDEKKEKRYRRVYAKLKDFEDYLISIGINTSLNENETPKIVETPIYSLMQGNDIVQNLKYLSINHNINLMYTLRDEFSLDEILEQARSEKNWKNLRQYIMVFEEYSTYLTQKQKLQTIKFLYDNLTHHEDDIRRLCAQLIGVLLAIFDEDYNKEIPKNVNIEVPNVSSSVLFEEYLNQLLYPSHKMIPDHRTWMGYSTKIMVNALFKNCRKSMHASYRNIILKYYDVSHSGNTETQLFLLETAKYIPMDPFEDSLNILFNYIISMTSKRSNILRLSALEVINDLLIKLPKDNYFKDTLLVHFASCCTRSTLPAENLLKLRIFTLLNMKTSIPIFQSFCEMDYAKIPDIFLSNLKTATDWIKKKNQIDLLLNYTINKAPSTSLHTAIHFCNLLKVSAVDSVRNSAGIAILKIMPYLTLPERNEISIELLRALEIEGHRFTEYIPHYLGEIFLWLQPVELNEIIDDLKIKIKIANENVKPLILKTLGIFLSNYPKYKTRFIEKSEEYDSRLLNILGILLNGLGDYKIKVKQSAISTFGKDVFGSKTLSLEEKIVIFKLTSKKILTLITEDDTEQLLFLTNSAALNHIYRFISDFNFFIGEIDIPSPKKIAFFPGTFDPFSLSHKSIANSIKDMGFEVYLSVDEFSWSKKTLPNLLRKNLISMSIADELNIFIYPENFPTNISNEEDLKQLKENFKGSQVYFASGSDVILNATCYKKPITENSIHNFPHIIFERGKNKQLNEAIKKILGEIKLINLPSTYARISSSQIRNYIDDNRDISSLIDPLVQQYIYENGFYQREPLDKLSLSYPHIDIEFAEEFTEVFIKKLSNSCNDKALVFQILTELSKKTAPKLVIIKDIQSHEILGFASMHWIRSNILYSELYDDKLSRYVRENASGRIVLIDLMYINNKEMNKEKNKLLEQVLITESLAYALSKDYEYAIFKPILQELYAPSLIELLYLHGFTKVDTTDPSLTALVVDMNNPCVLNLDLENILKEPFRSSPRVKQVISSTRKNLQKALSNLYPGELVLSFDSDVLHQQMIKKVCSENNVPIKISHNKQNGDAMCVPYGDILDRYIVPNTVTKSLHTEKFFSPNIKKFHIGEFPYYLNLQHQIKMIKSFNRPVILVDNILHKGYRMKALDPLLKNEFVNVKKIIAGILSGRGKDLMDMQNRDVDSVYFIPKLKIWFNENTLYPFIGGDALWRGFYPNRNLLPSINLILPYTYPVFIKNARSKEIYELSRVCIENSIELLKVLENEYHILYTRNLTLASLGEVFTIPRCPDIGKDMHYDLNISPSHYLENDLQQLGRLNNLL